MDMKTDARQLYESQQRGVTHLYEHDATQFVAPMGYGKTVVAMTAISELIENEVISCALTIAPKRVAQLVWPAEQKAWPHLSHLTVKVIDGGPASRARKLSVADADIYVIGVDHVPWLVAFLKTLPDDHWLFDCLCIDELSKFKAPRGKWSRAMRSIAKKFKIRWGLTGTPRPNGLMDQFAPLGIITANRLWGKTFDPWREKYFEATDFKRFHWKVRPEHEAKLEADIRTVTVTVSDEDMQDLPELVFRDHWITLPPHLRETYKGMEKKLTADAIVAANMGVATIKLAQIIQGFLYGDTPADTQYVHGLKQSLLEELISSLDGDPCIVVYEFQEDLNRMQQMWPDLRWFGHNTTDAQARQNEEDWNAGKLPLLAMHPAAAGHGLNLQYGGHQMIWYGMTWSPELYEQTIARIHRQGQSDRCFIHRILAHDTIDVAKLIRIDEKLDAQEAFKQYLRRV